MNWFSKILSAKYIAVIILGAAFFTLSFSACQQAGAALSNLQPEQNEALSGGSGTVFDQTVNAFALPIPGLSDEDELIFFVGNSFFNQNWVQAPSSTEARDGLGPHFSAKSCSGCHFKDGRGQPPASVGQLSEGMIIRLSIPGINEHGGPLADPVYGGQFQEHSITTAKEEGTYAITWEEISGKYPDGTPYTLRKPVFTFSDLQYGPMSENIMTSPRVAPQMIGLGLLESIDADAIIAAADPDDKNGDGISGRPNYVWNVITQKEELGRFGWKANEPSLLQQICGAFNGDIGITTDYFKDQHISAQQKELNTLPTGGAPEMPHDDLQKLHLYTATLAVPARRNVEDKQVLQGKEIFKSVGCNKCHTEKFTTGSATEFTVLHNQTIRPFTDMLLHDMGSGLADGRPDFLASGSEWRTPPLWGIGLFKTVNKHTFYLHDGRARSIEEAILWHGGEAEQIKQSYMQLDKSDRDKLLAFLQSL